jgi:hypothetical protein
MVLEESRKRRPLGISDLAIRGGDIIPFCDNNFSLVGKTLSHLLAKVIDNPSLNKREELIEMAKNYINMNNFD